MKKSAFIIAAAALTLAGCSGNKKAAQPAADTDSAFIQEAEAAIDSIQTPTLTAQGIGDVRIGMALDSVPQGQINLYDNIVADDSGEFKALNFRLGDKDMFTVTDYDDGKVDMISLYTSGVGVAVPNDTLRIGDPFTKLLKQSGVTTEFVSMDDMGVWYWRYKDLWFWPAEEGMNQALSNAMSERRNPPSAAMIGDGVKIGYIGTGVPF